MKVYIYLNTEVIPFFNGIVADPSKVIGTDFNISYYEDHQPGTLMVSIDIDTFIYLQDNELIKPIRQI